VYESPELDKDYLTRWIEAEYEVMGWWPKVKDVAVEPLIKEIKDGNSST